MSEAALKPENAKVGDLIAAYQAGRVVIPEFQREYVWKPSKAWRLVDSLYKGFPVSSLLIWQSGGEKVRARRRDPRPAATSTASWLIDGQQRVITLSRTKTGDEGIDVVFHLDDEEFQLANAATKNDPNWVRVSDIWNDENYRRIWRNLAQDDSAKSRSREARLEKVRAVLSYEIPVIRMVNHSFDDAVEAFSRINTQGVRLRKPDIESAKVAARHSGFIADSVVPFIDALKKQGFTRLSVMHLFRACAFVAQPDGRNRTPLHELDRKEVVSAWERTQRATRDATGIIRSELGLVNMDVLWSGSLLVPLIALCATTSARNRQPRALTGWLALAALLHRYSGSSETALEQDLKACRHTDPIGALLANLKQQRSVLRAKPADFAGAINDRSGLLASYIACRHRGIKDFFTAGNVILQASIDRHHIFPRAQFREKQRSRADTVANIAFIAGGINRELSTELPENYLPEVENRVLRSQCVPLSRELWPLGRADAFWVERRKLLADAFNDFLASALPNRRLARRV